MLLLLVLVVLVPSCKGRRQVIVPPRATASASAGAAFKPETIKIGETFWHAGFKVELTEASFEQLEQDFLTNERFIVKFEAVFNNEGTSSAKFNSETVLTSGGNDFGNRISSEDLPEVPGESKQTGSFAISVEADFTFDDAILTVGRSDNQQAIIPLGDEGKLVDLAPRDVTVTGNVTAGAAVLSVTGAEIRADIPNKHESTKEGELALTIFFSGTLTAKASPNLQGSNLSLSLPDGTALAVRSGSGEAPNVILGVGTTTSDLLVRFDIKDPPEGEYGLVLKGPYGDRSSRVEGELKFKLT